MATSESRVTERDMCYLQCTVHALEAELRPCSVRLSVRERCCMFPCFTREHVVARFSLQQDCWTKTNSGQLVYETSLCEVDMKRLRGLEVDQHIRVKCCTGKQTNKTCLDLSLGSLMDALMTRALPVTVNLSSTTSGLTLYTSPQLNSVCTTNGNTEEEEMASDTYQQQPDDEVTAQDIVASMVDASENEKTLTSTPMATDDNKWVTFGPTPTGKYISLPAHEKDPNDGWRGPGAWTYEDDLLDEQAMKIINAIVPLTVKKVEKGASINKRRDLPVISATQRPKISETMWTKRRHTIISSPTCPDDMEPAFPSSILSPPMPPRFHDHYSKRPASVTHRPQQNVRPVVRGLGGPRHRTRSSLTLLTIIFLLLVICWILGAEALPKTLQ